MLALPVVSESKVVHQLSKLLPAFFPFVSVHPEFFDSHKCMSGLRVQQQIQLQRTPNHHSERWQLLTARLSRIRVD